MSNRVSDTISDDTLNRIIQIESAGNPYIKAQTSSATGLGQQLNATWLTLVNKYRPEWWKGRTKEQVLNLRKNPSLNIEMLARLTEENARIVGSTTGGDLYLAHFLGPADAKDFFRADPATKATSLVSDAVVRANRSIMLNKDGSSKTAGEVRAWAARKMARPPDQNWVNKFYTGKGPDPKRVVPKDEPSPIDDDAKGTPIEKPEPPEPRRDPTPDDDAKQDAEQDAEEDRRDPVPEVTPAPDKKEGFGGWLGRQWKAISAWVSGLTSTGILAYLTDWKVVATFGAIAVALIVVAFFIWKATRK